MKARSNRLGFALAGIATIAFGCGAVGCSSGSSGGGSTPDTNANSGGSTSSSSSCANNLQIAFAPDMYSAYIPNSNQTFQLPVVANGVSGATVKWTASDPSKVQIDTGDTSGGAMLTMQGSGDVTITATANGLCGSSTLHITAATEDQWQAGSTRYNNMNPLPNILPADGGLPANFNPATITLDPPDKPPACTNCHGDQATNNVFKTISHTPEQTGGFSDAQLIQIFTAGAIPQNGYFDQSIIPSFVWSFFHKWSDITGDAQQGMVVYLRSLAPKSQGGMVDFNGLMLPRIMLPGTGSGGSTATGSGGTTTSGSGGTTAKGSGGTTGTGGTTSSTGGTTTASAGAAGAAGGDTSKGGQGGAAGAAGSK